MDQTNTTSVEIRVEGRVQGVNYRASARRTARVLGIDAEPVNLDDGSVRIRASGPSEAIERFIAWCHDGPPAANVTGVSVTKHG
jgi:acylphosphatase